MEKPSEQRQLINLIEINAEEHAYIWQKAGRPLGSTAKLCLDYFGINYPDALVFNKNLRGGEFSGFIHKRDERDQNNPSFFAKDGHISNTIDSIKEAMASADSDTVYVFCYSPHATMLTEKFYEKGFDIVTPLDIIQKRTFQTKTAKNAN